MGQIAAGDRQAFERLLDQYVEGVFLFCFSVMKDVASAEDMTQETFAKLWRNAGKWSPSGRPKSWLLRIAHNVCIDELRTRKPHVDIETAESLLPYAEASQETQIYHHQMADDVKAALFDLPERQRTALMLVYYSDCSNAEAAEILEISVDALESLLSRGRKSLRVTLKGQQKYFKEG